MRLHPTCSAGGANLPQPVPDVVPLPPAIPVPPGPELPPPEVVEPPLPGGHFPFHEPAWREPLAFCLH